MSLFRPFCSSPGPIRTRSTLSGALRCRSAMIGHIAPMLLAGDTAIDGGKLHYRADALAAPGIVIAAPALDRIFENSRGDAVFANCVQSAMYPDFDGYDGRPANVSHGVH